MYTLKEYSKLTKRYINNYVLPKSKDNGIIDFNDEYITEESIDNYITASLCTSYDSSNPSGYWEHIYETLIKSHDYHKLRKYLRNWFNDASFIEVTNNDSNTKAFNIYVKSSKLTTDILLYVNAKKFNNVENHDIPQSLLDTMNFFNYYFSSVRKIYNENLYCILCEPKYSEKVTKIVYEKYNGVLCHLTTKQNWKNIKLKGLQLRGTSNLYRYIEPRINFILGNTEHEIYERANTIMKQKGYSNEECVLLKIDLNAGRKSEFNKSAYSLDFYKDTIYPEDFFVYTYGLIHPRFISVYERKNV